MKRLFIAIHIIQSEELKDAFQLLKESLSGERIKWVEDENLHLTIQFIGEVEEYIVPVIVEKLNTISPKQKIEFTIEGIGLLRNMSDPRVIYAGIKQIRGLMELRNEVESCLLNADILNERTKFMPHLTLGRIKFLKNKHIMEDILTDLRDTYFQKNICSEFILFESHLTPGGPVYKKIKAYSI